MTALTWDSEPVSDGLERVVLFLPSAQGVPWNGITSIAEGDSGSSTTQYFDGVPFTIATATETYSANLEAITYPEEFEQCESYPNVTFGLSYRETTDQGYLIHLIWNATAAPSSKTHNTRTNGVNLSTFSWDISTKTEYLDGEMPVSHLVIDPTTALPEVVATIEDSLSFGLLPTATEVLTLFRDNATVKITDLGDGTFTIEGPEELVRQIDGTTWDIESGGVQFIDEDEYNIESW